MKTLRAIMIMSVCLIAMQAHAEETTVVETADEVQACTSKYSSFPGSSSGEISCLCPVDAHASGSVWGDKIYTTDSSICKAAVHAGVIPKGKGGMVKAKPAPGCKLYSGAAANGVTTSDWGEFKTSFYFPGKGDGKCVEAPKDLCPGNFQALGKDEATCSCLPASMRGSVYGTGVYTTDSSICNAALHAGAVGPKGGKVKVKSAPGCDAYKGTKANGVSTSKWGKYQASFYFPDKGDGKCQ